MNKIKSQKRGIFIKTTIKRKRGLGTFTLFFTTMFKEIWVIQVEQRLVKIGEDLSSYDKSHLFLSFTKTSVTTTFYNGLWQYPTRYTKDKLILAFDDWQTDGIFKGILSCTDKESLLKRKIYYKSKSTTDPDISRKLLEPHTDVLLDANKIHW